MLDADYAATPYFATVFSLTFSPLILRAFIAALYACLIHISFALLTLLRAAVMPPPDVMPAPSMPLCFRYVAKSFDMRATY